ncbi:hypothetical protein QFZ54_002638 [Sphingomonas faeni]|nr:hypothetical protein [Sphingomonas faeni]
MGTTNTAATVTTADILELNAIGDVTFADWFPSHRPGDTVPPTPPQHVALVASAIGLRQRAALRPISQVVAIGTARLPRS